MSKVLTTRDNPYDPVTNYAEWYKFDTSNGYDSCGLLARISRTSDTMSEEDYEDEIDRAIDSIVSSPFINPTNIYISKEINSEKTE